MVARSARRPAPRTAALGGMALLVVCVLGLTTCGGGTDGAPPCEIGACPPALTLEITANDGGGAVKDVGISGASFACSEVPGATVCTSVDGSAGDYHLTITAPGFASTTLDTTVDANPERCSCGYFPATVAVQLGHLTCDARPAVAADSAPLSLAAAEPGSTETASVSRYQRTFPSGVRSRANDVMALDDGGFVVAGEGSPADSSFQEMRIVRTDASAQVVWDHAYPGAIGGFPGSSASVVGATADGGLFAAGYAVGAWLNVVALTQAYLVELDTDGSELHRIVWPAFQLGYDAIQDGLGTAAGGLLLVGATVPEPYHLPPWEVPPGAAFVVAVDVAGQGVASATSLDEAGRAAFADAIVELGAAGYRLAGGSHDAFGQRLFLAEVAPDGTVTSRRSFCGSDVGGASAAVGLLDGGMIVAGQTSVPPGDTVAPHGFVARLDASGGLVWTRVLAGAGAISVSGVALGAADTLAVVGTMTTATNASDGFLAKLDLGGNLAWVRTYGGDFEDGFSAIEATADGGFVIAGALGRAPLADGTQTTDSWLVRTDAEGRTGPLPAADPAR